MVLVDGALVPDFTVTFSSVSELAYFTRVKGGVHTYPSFVGARRGSVGDA